MKRGTWRTKQLPRGTRNAAIFLYISGICRSTTYPII
jgi:hypothetical protein